jgi:hypothetical protein
MTLSRIGITSSHHCEPTGRAHVRPMTGSAMQSRAAYDAWIARSRSRFDWRFIAHGLGVSASRLLQRSSVISRSIELQTREIPYDCGLKLYFARVAGQKCFPQHNPVTG